MFVNFTGCLHCTQSPNAGISYINTIKIRRDPSSARCLPHEESSPEMHYGALPCRVVEKLKLNYKKVIIIDTSLHAMLFWFPRL